MPAKRKKGEEFKQMTDVDRLIHEPARFMIMAYLYVVESGDQFSVSSRSGAPAVYKGATGTGTSP